MAELDDDPLINRDARYPIAVGRDVRVRIERRGVADAAAYEGTLLDLSPGGARLGVPISFSFADAVRLTADFGVESALYLEADAEVCWIRPAEDGSWIVGCSFTPKIAPDLLQQLASSAIIDRRQGARQTATVAATASWELGGTLIPIQLRNTSSGGFCITSPRCAATGEQVLLHLRKDDATISFIAARIQWCLRVEDQFIVGCALKDGKDYAVLRECSAANEPEARVEALTMRLRNGRNRIPAISACVWALAAIAWVVVSLMDHVSPTQRPQSRADVHPVDVQQAAVDSGDREHQTELAASPPPTSAPPAAKVADAASAANEGNLRDPDKSRAPAVTSVSPPPAPAVARADSMAMLGPVETPQPMVHPHPTPNKTAAPPRPPRLARPEPSAGVARRPESYGRAQSAPAIQASVDAAMAGALRSMSAGSASAASDARRQSAEAQKLYRSGSYQASAKVLRRLLEHGSQMPLDHYYLALALYQLGQHQEAAEYVRHGLRLEQTRPIENWGTVMMRNQGRARQWLEQKRLEYKRSAGNHATAVTRAIRESPPAAGAPRLVAQ